MLTTLGLILVINGSFVAFRHAATTWLSSFRSVPNWAPPSLMLGQETFNSSAPTPPRASKRRATSAYSSTVVPQMLMIVGTFSPLRNGQYLRMKPSTPGPWRPMALISPLVTSTVRGVGLPRTGSKPDALDDHRAELVEINELRIFDAVAEGARGHGHRVLQRQRCRS